MPYENAMDPRTSLVRHKYFTLRPKPLERWIWKQGLPQAAERIFWLHWEAGMRHGDWCSELALRHVAGECCVDVSTVTRAYQLLIRLGLIIRQDPGRDATRPFQQAITITEVRVPRELLVELSRTPNRTRPAPTIPAAVVLAPPSPDAPRTPSMTRTESQALFRKLSEAERSEFHRASQERRSSMRFDDPSTLTPEDRGRLLKLLAQISGARPERAAPPKGPAPAGPVSARKLSPLEIARTRRELLKSVPLGESIEILRQVIWSVEAGALRRFDRPLAINIALKKVRERLWTRPNRMPPQWILAAAAPEPCISA